MPKSSTRRLKNLQQFSEDFPPNPLIEMRGNIRQIDMAELMGVNKSVIASAEEGMFQLIPVAYRKQITDIKLVNKQYQAHRRAKREYNFDPNLFPPDPADTRPMKHLLEHYDLAPWTFGAKSCVHHVDIWKMQQDATQATQNFVEFLEQIRLAEIYPKWLIQFNQALRADNPTKLTLSGGRTKFRDMTTPKQDLDD